MTPAHVRQRPMAAQDLPLLHWLNRLHTVRR